MKGEEGMKNKATLLLLVLLGISLAACIMQTAKAQEPLLGDLNGDGKVNLYDLVTLAAKYGTTEGSPNWDPACDLNGDGTVSNADLVILAQNWTGY